MATFAGAVVDLVLTHPSPEGVTTDTDLLGDDFYCGGAEEYSDW